MKDWMTNEIISFFSFIFQGSEKQDHLPRLRRKGDERAWRRCESSTNRLFSESAKDAVFY